MTWPALPSAFSSHLHQRPPIPWDKVRTLDSSSVGVSRHALSVDHSGHFINAQLAS